MFWKHQRLQGPPFPLSIYVKWFSPTGSAAGSAPAVCHTATAGKEEETAVCLKNQAAKKEKKLREEKELKGRQYVTQYLKKKVGLLVVVESYGILTLSLSVVYKLAHFSHHVSSRKLWIFTFHCYFS